MTLEKNQFSIAVIRYTNDDLPTEIVNSICTEHAQSIEGDSCKCRLSSETNDVKRKQMSCFIL